MTNQAPPAPWRQDQPGQWHPGHDPRAAAAAEKAYIKASRPWYKKKRWVIPMAIAVLMVIASMAGGTGETTDGPQKVAGTSANAGNANASATKPSKSSVKGDAGSKSNPIAVGETVKLEGTQYTVKSVRKSPSVGDSFFKEKADGVYVTVTLMIENKKSETKTFLDSAAKFVTNDNNKYATDNDGTIAVMGNGEEPLILADMQPDLPKTGKLVFDVPPSKIKGGLLEVSDLFGGGEAYIALGLR
jgi:hypothetical protein